MQNSMRKASFSALIGELRKHYEQAPAPWDDDCPCQRGRKMRAGVPCPDCLVDELERRGAPRDAAMAACEDLAEIRDRESRLGEKIKGLQEVVSDPRR
ncbi:hypothetical protein [Thioalkalivibrio sp. ALE19]|uniref:hypothetical protein n=1 Tax=Thioalkalivibrio sp. ALE19 TaxID=1266909 RepID=UPI0004047EC0|nr:hypothetical protein [Thioalkalivibrio sp. ALE19]